MKYLSVFPLAAVAACTVPDEPKPTVTPVLDETVITSTASTTNTLVLDRNTSFITCTAPAPDATFSQGETGSVSAAAVGSSDGVTAGETSSAAGLPGRSPAVLMTRELFFRSCEFSRNYNLTKSEAYDLYVKTLDVASTGWSREAGNTTVSIGESQTADVTNQTVLTPTAQTAASLPSSSPSADGF